MFVNTQVLAHEFKTLFLAALHLLCAIDDGFGIIHYRSSIAPKKRARRRDGRMLVFDSRES